MFPATTAAAAAAAVVSIKDVGGVPLIVAECRRCRVIMVGAELPKASGGCDDVVGGGPEAKSASPCLEDADEEDNVLAI